MDTNNSTPTNKNKILDFIKSKKSTVIILVIFELALLISVFSIGVAVGYHKANFSFAWGENYHRNFGGPRGGFLNGLTQDIGGTDFIDGHGTFGQIISANGSELVVKGKDNVEKIIIVNDDTNIRRFQNSIQIKDLMIGDQIVVIGEPDTQGKIEAKFIRIMPTPSNLPIEK